MKERKTQLQHSTKTKIAALIAILLITAVMVMANSTNIPVKAQEEEQHGGNPIESAARFRLVLFLTFRWKPLAI